MDIRHDEGLTEPVSSGIWPEESLARVPYWVYQDPENYTRELSRLFERPTWNYDRPSLACCDAGSRRCLIRQALRRSLVFLRHVTTPLHLGCAKDISR